MLTQITAEEPVTDNNGGGVEVAAPGEELADVSGGEVASAGNASEVMNALAINGDTTDSSTVPPNHESPAQPPAPSNDRGDAERMDAPGGQDKAERAQRSNFYTQGESWPCKF